MSAYIVKILWYVFEWTAAVFCGFPSVSIPSLVVSRGYLNAVVATVLLHLTQPSIKLALRIVWENFSLCEVGLSFILHDTFLLVLAFVALCRAIDLNRFPSQISNSSGEQVKAIDRVLLIVTCGSLVLIVTSLLLFCCWCFGAKGLWKLVSFLQIHRANDAKVHFRSWI